MTPLEALQATLAGEHAAVYVYGVVGGRVSASTHPDLAARVVAGYTTHRARRDQVDAMVRAAGGRPVPAAVSYRVGSPATTTAELTRVARRVETRSAEVYAQLVGSTSRANRQWALEALTDAAVRALGFGAPPTAFPGTPGL